MQAVLHNKFTVQIGGVDYTHRVPFPIKWSQLLDEQLDEASLMLIRTKTKNIPPLTDVVITMWNEKDPSVTQTLNMIVASDKSDEIPAGSGRYNHEMYLIEQTKYLEGFLCRSQGYVNSLGKTYPEYAQTVEPDIVIEGGEIYADDPAETISSPLGVGTVTFPSLYEMFPDGWSFPAASETYDNTVSVIQNGVEIAKQSEYNQPVTATVVQGIIQVVYRFFLGKYPPLQQVYGTMTYQVNIVGLNVSPLPKWNARTVIERALTIAETLREGDTPRFTLNAEQAAQFESIETPEFNFTQSTLREILQEVGRYVHGEPRLRDNVIYYDMYGSDEPTDVYYANYAAQSFQQTVERYATNLDSNVDNFVNALGYARGVIVEPYSGAYKTVQTETLYARITEDNMMISTKYPIRGITSVKCGLVNGSVPAADITPYIVESSEYNRMSSYSELYPDSKAYALYYTVGERNIYGLGFKYQGDWITGGAFAEYAIVNILRAATGTSVTPNDYPLLAFEVTYEPIFPARVQQSKSCILDLKKQRTIAYNQGQNVIETHYYGENMKGVIARLGNVDRTLTFVQRGLPSLPKIGTIYEDDYYVSAVAAEMHPTYTKVSIALSQDFNRYSDYVGISSTKRFYEVSERQAYDSHIAYRDYVIIGDAAQNAGDALFDVTDLSEIFTQSGSMEPLSLLLAQGEDAGGNALPEIALPLNVAAMGNAALITTKYDDNYSAGNNSTYQSEGNVTGYFTNGVAYSDVHGNIEYLHLNYYTGGTVPTSQDQQNQIGLSLPDATYVDGVGKAYISTGSRPLWVKKGSTEIPSLPYQMDFVTNRRNIVVGSALAKNCPFVSGTQSGHGAVLYVLPKRLNKFRLTADLTGATQIKDYTGGSGITAANGTISFAPQTSSVSGQAWVMADKATGEVLIGCNRAITPEDEDILDKLTITAKHDIYV
jgi:hypothetical protein